MEFSIQVLKQKKGEIVKEYKDETDVIKTATCKMLCDDLDKAIKELEYEYHWKHLSEKQIDEKLGNRKTR
ncbi:hypothetical protein MH122_13820 [Bacillus pumilus]|uniref:hypothetical protein n=1 Tax=Bacillus pumilus TaxID=1408 RepID=UPI002282F6F9|nr:hypothetical protein [Bacillus pumilus]MCY7679876.1 hypothetical protein [Bacillus pumilus]